MNNEIKEILREMKEMCEIWVKVDGNMKSYNQDQIHCIYDYITNLQEENKELNDDNIWWNNRFKAVERDNREYKAKLEMYENGVYFSSENDKLQQEIERLNNIINDLYNGLEQIIEQGYDYSEKDIIAYKLQDKIKKLKGDSSNE